MSTYLRQIYVEPAGDAHAIALAKNCSSCPEAERFGVSVIDAKGEVTTLGALGFPFGVEAIAGAGRVARGAAVGLSQGVGRAVVVDLATTKLIAELALRSRAYRIALDGDGATLACVLADRVAFYAVATQQEVASVPLSTERSFQGYIAWCAADWVVARAARAPIVALGIGKATASVVDFGVPEAKRKAASVALPPAKDRYAAVTVAIAADGERMIARGTECEAVYLVARGAKTATEHTPAKSVTEPLGKNQLWTTPGFAIVGEDVVVYDGDTVARS
jgi:hypothetical protein